eukprot:1138934-Pyramimonas_sp.AAC.1
MIQNYIPVLISIHSISAISCVPYSASCVSLFTGLACAIPVQTVERSLQCSLPVKSSHDVYMIGRDKVCIEFKFAVEACSHVENQPPLFRAIVFL